MTRRIVVGIDGSQHSGNALEWAVARARLGGEQLELISAYSVAPALDFYSYHALADSQPIDWYAEHSQQVLEAAATRVRELAPELACTLTPARGHAANLLATASEGADVVVVGRRGLGRAASALLGSVSNRLTVEAKCPVVVVGDGELPTRGPIVVGVDGSEFGTSALRYALGEAALRRTTVRAVAAYDFLSQVYRIDAELTERIRKEAEAQAAETITCAAEEARWADPAAVGVAEVVVEGPPAEAILAHAGDAQLVVVGTHGKGIVRRVLMGSVSRQVLHDADRPVAVVDHRGD